MSTCTVCGGTGIQRVSSQRFRTCLACLGTGKIGAAVQSAPLNQIKLKVEAVAGSSVLPTAAG